MMDDRSYACLVKQGIAGAERDASVPGRWLVRCEHLQHAQYAALARRHLDVCDNSGIVVSSGDKWRLVGFDLQRDSWAVGRVVALVVDRAATELDIQLANNPRMDPLLTVRIIQVEDTGLIVAPVQVSHNLAGYTFIRFSPSAYTIPVRDIMWWAPLA